MKDVTAGYDGQKEDKPEGATSTVQYSVELTTGYRTIIARVYRGEDQIGILQVEDEEEYRWLKEKITGPREMLLPMSEK